MNKILSLRFFNSLLKIFRNNKCVIILLSVLLSGIAVGSIFSSVADFKFIFNDFYAFRQDNSAVKVFISSFSAGFFYILISYFSGLFVFGSIVSIFLPFFKGLGFGILCGYVYSSFGILGFAFSLVIIIPYEVISALCLVYSCIKSFRLSLLFGSVLTRNPCYINVSAIKKYSLNFLKYILIMAIASIVDAVMSCLFIGVFVF